MLEMTVLHYPLILTTGITWFLAALLFTAKSRTASALAVYLGVAGFVYLSAYLELRYSHAAFALVVLYANQILIPLLFRYLRALVGRPRRRFGPELLPGITTLLIVGAVFVVGDSDGIDRFFSGVGRGRGFYLFTLLLEQAIVPALLVPGYLMLREYGRSLKESYSYLRFLDYRWLRLILITEGLSWVIFATVALIDSANETMFRGGVLFSAGLTVFVGFYGIRYANIAPHAVLEGPHGGSRPTAPAEGYRRSGLGAREREEIRETLCRSVEEERLFADPYLDLPTLAEKIGVQSNWISEVLNVSVGKNFYSFVNGYRVEEVRRRILAGELEKKTMLALAMEAGFNSKAAFNRNFKELTGETPSEFAKRSRRVR